MRSYPCPPIHEKKITPSFVSVIRQTLAAFFCGVLGGALGMTVLFAIIR